MKQLPDRRTLFLIAAAGLAAMALAQAQEPAVRIISPENGGVVEGRNVELKMKVQGVELTPRRSSNATSVRVELRRTDGSEFRPPRRTQVRFTVRSMER